MVAIDREEQIRGIVQPRITQAGNARHPAGYDIETRRVSARKVRVRAIADNGRVYSDTLTDSAPNENLQDLAEQYAAAPSEAELLAMLTLEERILVEFTAGIRGWFEPVEYLSDEIAVIEWTQPQAGRVRGCVVRTDETNDNGEPVWIWNGTFDPVEGEPKFDGFIVELPGGQGMPIFSS